MAKYRRGDTSRLSRRIAVTAAALIAPLAVLACTSTALASEHHPTGIYAPFADCPLSNPSVELCTIAETTSGEFTIGSKTVPIENTITLQAGAIENPKTEELEFVAAEDGNTLSKAPQTVPGGLLGIVAPEFLPKFLQEIINELVNNGLAGVTATAELAKPASAIKLNPVHLLFEEGVALQLPLKVKLSNTFLGGNCYVGSSSKPIALNLTTGTTSPPEPNKPIKGAVGSLAIFERGNLVVLTGNSLVDNAFAAPEASGCGGLLSFLIDPAVDIETGLPAAAGHNTAVLSGKVEEAVASAVIASE